MTDKRKVCVVITSKQNYGRMKPLLEEIKNHEGLELQLVVGASALLYRYGMFIDVIKKDGFKPLRSLYYVVEGENLITQAKSTGLGIVELSTSFEDLKPDIVVAIGDRYETMATAVAASYINIPLAHIQGGEVTGNIDDSVRHAITKIAHLHFPATEKSAERIIKMGEESWRVHNVGCPSIDIIVKNNLKIDNDEFNAKYGGLGGPIDFKKPFILLIQHPVTTSYGEGRKQINETLEALKNRKEQKILIWPNNDAGSDDVSKGIRVFREENVESNFHYHRAFEPVDYLKLLNNAICAVGNSSSFIREGSFLGTPSVIVGDRQEMREHSDNIVFSDYSSEEIAKNIDNQIKHGRYKSSNIFGTGNASKEIANILNETNLDIIIKKMTY
jgi:UDP-hydrolysing UDP-N-acetyl-D-glucosamine 2-epimerase